MRVDFPDGSFMLSWDKCRAWYNSDGSLKDCEYKRKRKGFLVAAAIPAKHTKVRAWLCAQGATESRLLDAGILKRKTLA